VSQVSVRRPEREGLLAELRPGLLADFQAAGVLGLADVHTARALGRIGGESDEDVLLATALTVRALRLGSVCLDLSRVSGDIFDLAEELLDSSVLPWPNPVAWVAACERSPLVSVGADAPGGTPLRLVSGLLYLERYWGQEEQVRRQLQDRTRLDPPAVDLARLSAALERLFPRTGLAAGEPDLQKLAAAVCMLRRVTVLAGGPGTGKTTTIARLLALLNDQPGGAGRVALTAPTGKAAARLGAAIAEAGTGWSPADAAGLGSVTTSTLHRLLGWRPDTRSRFRHHAGNRLPHDVLVVDEMSMVSLTLMARLLEAVRPEARLILVGDPDQLSSVEAGAVLADIAEAPVAADQRVTRPLGELPVPTAAQHVEEAGRGVVRLRHTWRFGGAINELARAVRAADADAAVAVLRSGDAAITFVESDLGAVAPAGLAPLVDAAVGAARATWTAARAGDAAIALAGLETHRLLCAHRRGPHGVVRWGVEVERWLVGALPGYAEEGEWHSGRPLLVTANDYDLSLYNGDLGVVVQTDAGPRAAFGGSGHPRLLAPVRLAAVQTVHAMTVHRAQGSQFGCVSFILPPADSPLLTRELLYTAVTRATTSVQIFGSEESVRRAIARPANRASGLRHRLAHSG
jgi:exodeoxyribonuclease V alpha subunit